MSIKQSDTAYPQGVNQRRDWPTHTRDWKQEVFDVFKNCTGEVTSTDTELSYFKGTINRFLNNRKLSSVYSDSIYTITPSPAITSLLDGLQFRFKAGGTNVGGAKLRVNSIAERDIVDLDGNTLSDAYIYENAIIHVCYVSDDDKFFIVGL